MFLIGSLENAQRKMNSRPVIWRLKKYKLCKSSQALSRTWTMFEGISDCGYVLLYANALLYCKCFLPRNLKKKLTWILVLTYYVGYDVLSITGKSYLLDKSDRSKFPKLITSVFQKRTFLSSKIVLNTDQLT